MNKAVILEKDRGIDQTLIKNGKEGAYSPFQKILRIIHQILSNVLLN
jgi:hypothetical protein